VTDRLAWLSYVHGSLAGGLAEKVDSSRLTFKHLRDAENAQLPRRNIRTGLQNQIAKLEHDQKREQQQRLAELKVQLQKNEEEDATAEKDIEVLKRKAVRESEQAKWEAVREVSSMVTTFRSLC
jgi:molecular chaperone GrpE (heat shock protein)